MSNNRKHILKVHHDVMTANEVISIMEEMHKAEGYQTKRISPIHTQIIFDDGIVNFWWEKGYIYFQ